MMSLRDVYYLLKIDLRTVLLSCLIYATCALQLTIKNSRYQSETFIKCETVTIECVIKPYMNALSWKYDSKEVALCSFANCQVKSDTEGFTFKFDTVNGIFQLIIDKVKDEHNNKIIECLDGTDTDPATVTIAFKGWKSYSYAILIAVIIFFNIIAVIVIMCLRKWDSGRALYSCLTNVAPSEAGRNQCPTLRQEILKFCMPLGYFIIGVLLTVILILVTRFSEDSVVEVYDSICGWEILLILFGIYVSIALSLFVALIVVVVKGNPSSRRGNVT